VASASGVEPTSGSEGGVEGYDECLQERDE
jgi:hypothetical protein